MDSEKIFSFVNKSDFQKNYRDLSWEGTFKQYVDMVLESPQIAQTAFQRLYEMIASYGYDTYTEYKKKITRWKFFDDPVDGGADAVYGLDVHLMKLVNIIKAGAYQYGPEKRVILLHGPVGSAKSTIVRLMKKGLERFSQTSQGALYSFKWINLKDILNMEDVLPCPMHEEPLHLIPLEHRMPVLSELNKNRHQDQNIYIEGELCPPCRYIFKRLLEHYSGDWAELTRKHIAVRRVTLSERDRIGIGTFQPKDEKNQDSTELTGDINYRKIAIYGSDSDPRAFNFDGEFNIANRGVIEFIEVLKLDVAFLYDLLTASQEHKIKPKKFAQTDIDLVIIGHTNEPEYRKLQNNEYMEALRDRTVKIDVPYITRLSQEVKIYQKGFNSRTVPNIHLAPHMLEMASMWAVLTRLEEPKKANLTLMQKLKLYNGKTSQHFTEDNIKELRKEAKREGMAGISPRYIQDKISNALIIDKGGGCINPFIVLNELGGGLKGHSLITDEETRKRYHELLGEVKKEYEDIVKHEVQRAISADESAIEKLCGNYIDNVKAYIQKEKIRNPYTGAEDEPDERLMRSIEEKIEIADNRKEDFRREIMNYIGALALEGKSFDFRMNERLHKALELKLFEDQKDTIKLTTLVSKVVDKETQAKIDIVKDRLIKNYGYCDICASDALSFVASIFARGDATKNERK
ncbi:MAG: serine protein kinase [Deltaproteobacteria bacterium]|nr:serine protein kinase [Deltaproteobacteria bacterium]